MGGLPAGRRWEAWARQAPMASRGLLYRSYRRSCCSTAAVLVRCCCWCWFEKIPPDVMLLLCFCSSSGTQASHVGVQGRTLPVPDSPEKKRPVAVHPSSTSLRAPCHRQEKAVWTYCQQPNEGFHCLRLDVGHGEATIFLSRTFSVAPHTERQQH